MLLQILRHAKTFYFLLAENRLHGLVRSEPLLLIGVLQVVLLQIVPQLLHYL